MPVPKSLGQDDGYAEGLRDCAGQPEEGAMNCPNCGHQFRQVPKMNPQLRFRLKMLAQAILMKCPVEGEITSADISQACRETAKLLGSARYILSSAEIYIRALGVITHPAPNGRRSVRLRYLVNVELMKKLAEEGSL